LACSSFLLAQPSPPELYPLSLHDALPIYLGQGGDVFAVERGLGKTALPEPELALAREEAVAEQRFRLLEATPLRVVPRVLDEHVDRKSTRLNSSHVKISYAVFCLKKKNTA